MAGGRLLRTIDLNCTSVYTGAVTVGTTAVHLGTGSTPVSGRKRLLVCNNSSAVVYLGSSSVTTTNGFPLQPNDWLAIDGEVAVYGIAAAAGNNVRVMELV